MVEDGAGAVVPDLGTTPGVGGIGLGMSMATGRVGVAVGVVVAFAGVRTGGVAFEGTCFRIGDATDMGVPNILIPIPAFPPGISVDLTCLGVNDPSTLAAVDMAKSSHDDAKESVSRAARPGFGNGMPFGLWTISLKLPNSRSKSRRCTVGKTLRTARMVVRRAAASRSSGSVSAPTFSARMSLSVSLNACEMRIASLY